MDIQLTITLEEAHVIYNALHNWRKWQVFNAGAIMSTDEEKDDANRQLVVLDKLMGSLEDTVA